MTSSHDLDLEDGLFDAPGPDERGVGGVRGECDGVAGLDMDGLGDGVVEEHDVVAGIDVLGLDFREPLIHIVQTRFQFLVVVACCASSTTRA